MRSARSWLRTGAVLILTVALVACAAATTPSAVPGAAGPSQATSPAAPSAGPSTASPSQPTPPPFALGGFPSFPIAPLPDASSAGLQAALDDAVKDGIFDGITAAVIVADTGSWVGVSGSADGVTLTPDSRRPTHSSAKTIVAAEVLRLVEEGHLQLDDRAADHLPADLAFYDANGATVRQVLGMLSGIPDLNEYDGYYPAEQASSAAEVFRLLPEPRVSPGAEQRYASTNFVLLGSIIEHITGLPLADALRSGVLDQPGLEGIDYTVDDALAGDGWGVETTPASWARWAYDLYGGSVISEASLREMTDFQGAWYGLGTMDFSSLFGGLAVGHEGESSVTTCCSVIKLVALPDRGVVISVQADTGSSLTDRDYYRAMEALTKALWDVVRT